MTGVQTCALPIYARQIFHRLLIDLSWNSSRLEGNTYSLLETERLLEFGVEAEGKDAKEAQMIFSSLQQQDYTPVKMFIDKKAGGKANILSIPQKKDL